MACYSSLRKGVKKWKGGNWQRSHGYHCGVSVLPSTGLYGGRNNEKQILIPKNYISNMLWLTKNNKYKFPTGFELL